MPTPIRQRDNRAALGLLGILAVVLAGVLAMCASTYHGPPVVLRLALGLVGGAVAVGGVWAATEVVA